MVFAIKDDRLVSFVGVNTYVRRGFLQDQFSERLDLLLAGDSAGWVGWEIQIDEPGVVVDEWLELIGCQGKTIIFAQMDRHRFRSHVGNVGLVKRITGSRIDDLIAEFAI